ncbi:hypothetical protein C8R47DRAFT_1193536 [Mycena vitilis]|nr:hypothetical protein C8R47DRAFT_1193536 [Mycena vitilis]
MNFNPSPTYLTAILLMGRDKGPETLARPCAPYVGTSIRRNEYPSSDVGHLRRLCIDFRRSGTSSYTALPVNPLEHRAVFFVEVKTRLEARYAPARSQPARAIRRSVARGFLVFRSSTAERLGIHGRCSSDSSSGLLDHPTHVFFRNNPLLSASLGTLRRVKTKGNSLNSMRKVVLWLEKARKLVQHPVGGYFQVIEEISIGQNTLILSQLAAYCTMLPTPPPTLIRASDHERTPDLAIFGATDNERFTPWLPAWNGRRRFDEAQGVEVTPPADAPPAKKCVTAKGLKPTTSSGRAPPLSLAWSGLPPMYPTIMRDDELPEEFNKHISSLFRRPQRLMEGFGSLGSAVSFLGLQVFAAIPQDGKPT